VDNCHVLLSFPDYTNSPVVSSTKYLECAVTPYHDVAVDDDIQPCDSYAHHGHCPDGKACKKSHDIDLILLKKEGNALRKGTTTAANGDGHEVNGGSAKKRKKAGSGGGGKANNRFGLASFGGHRAGFDAFMTGFAMVAFRARKENWKEHANKVYLVSKDFPLLVKKSAFAKISVSHFEKFARLKQTAEAAAAASDGGEA
jgi:target of EGR1 protein 1